MHRNLLVMRVLGRTRISRSSDESTSITRQREYVEAWAAANDHQIVGWADDEDISGGIDPFKTPALGPWLTPDKAQEWDILCAWKLDRLGRDSIRLNKLFGWAIDNGKILVTTSEGIDLSTPVGRLIANVIAFLAEGERAAISERTKSSQKHLRQTGRWAGGKPVYGYQPVPLDGGGWELQADPKASKVLQQIIDKVLAGQSTQSIATGLTEAGILTPADHIRDRAGKPTTGGAWSTNTIRTLLRSRSLLGHSVHKGVTVRDSEGQPVMIGPALITQERFNAVQAALDNTSLKVTNRSTGASPLLGVLVCQHCQRLMHLRQDHNKRRGKTYRYYQCLGGRGAGGGGTKGDHKPHILKADPVEKLLEDFMLESMADELEQERTWIPASDNTTELLSVRSAIEELTAAYTAAASATVKTTILSQINALDKQATELEQTPPEEGRWEYKPTGRTNGEAWKSMTPEERRDWMLRMGIQFTVDAAYKPNFYSPIKGLGEGRD